MFEEFGMYAIPAIALLGTGGLTYALAKKGKIAALWSIAGLIAVFSGLMLIGVENASGWDGLGYALALIGISAPSAAGFGLGGLIGWLRKPPQGAA